MRKIEILIISILIAVPAFSEKPWKRVVNENGIEVYTRGVEDSKFKEFKGIGEVNASIQVIANVLNDIAGMTDWMPNCSTSRLINKISPNHLILYQVIDSPWPVKNRDFIVESKITITRGKMHRTINAISHPEVPPVKENIRVIDMTGQWILTRIDDKKTHVLYQIKSDPAGKLPAWLVNTASKDLPYKAIKGLREMVELDKYL